MALYSLAVRTLGTSSPIASVEFIARAKTARILEITGVFVPGVTSSYYLARCGVIGAGPSPLAFTPDDPASPAATMIAAVTWSSPPLIPGVAIRRVSLGSGAASGFTWRFAAGLIVRPGSSVAFWGGPNATNAVIDLHCVIEE